MSAIRFNTESENTGTGRLLLQLYRHQNHWTETSNRWQRRCRFILDICCGLPYYQPHIHASWSQRNLQHLGSSYSSTFGTQCRDSLLSLLSHISVAGICCLGRVLENVLSSAACLLRLPTALFKLTLISGDITNNRSGRHHRGPRFHVRGAQTEPFALVWLHI